MSSEIWLYTRSCTPKKKRYPLNITKSYEMMKALANDIVIQNVSHTPIVFHFYLFT